jgi:uncharacterized protein with FMN-binding domain
MPFMMGLRRVLGMLACIVGAIAISGCQATERIERLEIKDVVLSTVKDGDYQSAQNYFPVTAKVLVSVRKGRIVDIKLLSHRHGPGHGAEAILQRVMDRQSLAVDAVSGATYSSKVVLKAIESALKKGF